MIQRTMLTRVFTYSGVRLQDPNAAMTPVQVRDFFAAAGRPELATAEVRDEGVKGAEQIFSFHRAVGTKGLKAPAERVDLHNLKVPEHIATSLARFERRPVTGNNAVNALMNAASGRSSDHKLPAPAQTVPWFF